MFEQADDYAALLEELIRLQRENRAQTASGVEFETLVLRQTKIRTNTARLARAMKKGALPVATMVGTLNELYAGLMADAIGLLETGRDTSDAARAGVVRNDSLPVQDEIVKQLQELLNRLQRNDQARKALRRIRKEAQRPAMHMLQVCIATLRKGADQVLIVLFLIETPDTQDHRRLALVEPGMRDRFLCFAEHLLVDDRIGNHLDAPRRQARHGGKIVRDIFGDRHIGVRTRVDPAKEAREHDSIGHRLPLETLGQDGVGDGDECPTGTVCLDSDGDAVPNYNDADDDNDGVPTAQEAAPTQDWTK